MSSGAARLAGKVAVVTASTEGIGFAIARRLGQDGAKVMLSSRKQQNVDRAVKELKAENLNVEGIVCHVGNKEDRQRLFKETKAKFGGIDILVSNAAVSTYFGQTLNTPEDAFDKMFEINVKASFMLCKEVVPELEKRGGGSLVLVSSIAGYIPFEKQFIIHLCAIFTEHKRMIVKFYKSEVQSISVTKKVFCNAIKVPCHLSGGTIVLVTSLAGYQPSSHIGVYSITKTALLGMVKTLAPELAPRKIRVNGLAPGIVQTKFSKALTNTESAKDLALKGIPLGRLGVPEDCASAVSFMVSDESSWMTGETIVLAGGAPSRL